MKPTTSAEPKVRTPRKRLRWLIVPLLLAGGAYWLTSDHSWQELRGQMEQLVDESAVKLDELKAQVTEKVDSDAGKQSIPPLANGTEHTYFSGKGVAPLTIFNRSSDQHAMIKIEDSRTGKPVAKYFIRAGKKIEKQLPLGRYKLKFATGKDWYGEPDLFGSQTEAVVMTGELTVTTKDDYIWIYPAEVEINIDLPIWSADRRQSKTMDSDSW